MQRWVALPALGGLLCCALAGCSADKPPAAPVAVPTISAPASEAPPEPGTPVVPGTAPTASTPPGAPAPPAAPPRPATPAPLPYAGTSDIRVPRAGAGHLSAVRLARQDGYDRLVLEFTDQVPGYTVGYRALPATADGSGADVPLPGATTFVAITLSPAAAHRDDTGAPTYTGPATVDGKTVQVTQARAAGDFEAVLNWVVGTRKKTPFRVLELTGPPRLVVDFQH